jgi:hypothetical protein
MGDRVTLPAVSGRGSLVFEDTLVRSMSASPMRPNIRTSSGAPSKPSRIKIAQLGTVEKHETEDDKPEHDNGK